MSRSPDRAAQRLFALDNHSPGVILCVWVVALSQQVKQLTLNQVVAGLNPARGTVPLQLIPGSWETEIKLSRTITKQSAITLVELSPTLFGVLDGKPSFDVYSQFRLPARALHALEGVLRADDWQNVQSIMPAIHGKKGRLTEENHRRIRESAVLAIGSILRTTPQSMALVRLYKQANPDGIVIVGGTAPTFAIPEWLSVADVVVCGEGERTLSELMTRIEKGEGLEDLDGVAFKKGRQIVVTHPRRLMTSEEMSRLPHPYYDERTRSRVRVATMETARGCPNNCNFCCVTEFYGGKYRAKSIDYVIDGLQRIQGMAGRVFFVDDNFYGDPRRAMDMVNAIADSPVRRIMGTVQLTVKAAKDAAFLKALRKAGIWSVCLGIESVVDQTLKDYGKPASAEQNKEAARTFREAGFWVHGLMMLGGDGDTPESLKETSEWLNQNLDSIELFAPTPYQGTRFHARMQSEGRILTDDLSIYDGQHVVIRPNNLSAFQLQETITRIYESFYSWPRILQRTFNGPHKEFIHFKHNVTINSYVALRSISECLRDPQTRKYLEFLKSIG